MVEGARLESVYTLRYRGFEPLPLRQFHSGTLTNLRSSPRVVPLNPSLSAKTKKGSLLGPLLVLKFGSRLESAPGPASADVSNDPISQHNMKVVLRL